MGPLTMDGTVITCMRVHTTADGGMGILGDTDTMVARGATGQAM